MQEFYDVRELNGYTTMIAYDNGQIDEVSTHYMAGAAARALVGGSYGFTTVDDPARSGEAIDTALTLARRLNKLNPRPKISLAPPVFAAKEVYRVKKNPADKSLKEKQDFCKTIEAAMKAADPKGLIKSTRINYSESFAHSINYGSDEHRVEYDITRTGFSCTAIAGENGTLQVGRRSYFNVGGYEVFDQCDPLEAGERGDGRGGQAALREAGAQRPLRRGAGPGAGRRVHPRGGRPRVRGGHGPRRRLLPRGQDRPADRQPAGHRPRRPDAAALRLLSLRQRGRGFTSDHDHREGHHESVPELPGDGGEAGRPAGQRPGWRPGAAGRPHEQHVHRQRRR